MLALEQCQQIQQLITYHCLNGSERQWRIPRPEGVATLWILMRNGTRVVVGSGCLTSGRPPSAGECKTLIRSDRSVIYTRLLLRLIANEKTNKQWKMKLLAGTNHLPKQLKCRELRAPVHLIYKSHNVPAIYWYQLLKYGFIHLCWSTGTLLSFNWPC